MKIYISSVALVLCALATGCASQQYWVQKGKTLQEISADLYQCRVSSQPIGGKQVFSAAELEQPCMVARGYTLGNRPQE